MAAEPIGEPDLRTVARVTYLPDIHRLLPQAQEAEKGVLCSFLIAPREIGQLCTEHGVTPEHFYSPAHGIIYRTLKEFWDENEPADYVTITSYLKSKGMLDNIGGSAFITDLWTFVGTPANASHYISILREKFILREVIKICTEGAARSYDEQDDVPKLLSDTVDRMMKIVRIAEGQKTHSRTMRELVKLALDSFEAEMADPGHIEMPSGIPSLDFYTDGFIAPETTIILAPPSDGKTAIALNIAENLAVNCGKRVGIISLEMGDIQLTKRLLFSMARVNIREIKHRGYMTDEERDAIVAAGKRLQEARIFIRDDGALTTSEINATASAWKAQHGLDLLIVDHAQLARADRETEGRTSEVEAVSNAMKPIAKRLNVPLILLSQVTKTKEGDVVNYTAKNSKAIEADADNIWAISHTREKNEETGKLEIIDTKIVLAKQRDRERYVTVPLIFNERIQRFAEKSKEEAEQPALIDFGKLNKRPKKKD